MRPHCALGVPGRGGGKGACGVVCEIPCRNRELKCMGEAGAGTTGIRQVSAKVI